MTDYFKDARPSIERLTKELDKLESVTRLIHEAQESATRHADTAGHSRELTDAAVRAVQLVITGQEKFIDHLGQQHQRSLGEQELLLREQGEKLAQKTGEQVGRQLDEVRQTAEQVQELIDRLLTEQPARLDAIGKQHQQGMEKQQEMLRNGVQNWAEKLHGQLQVELKLLRQATEVLEKNTRQQHDELSTVANQLQVVAGRVTAFAEVMNAAKFTARLESIERQQKDTLASLAKSGAANEAALTKLADLYQQQGTGLLSELQRVEEVHEKRVDGLRELVEQLAGQLVQTSQQQRLWQSVTIAVVAAASAALYFLLRHSS